MTSYDRWKLASPYESKTEHADVLNLMTESEKQRLREEVRTWYCVHDNLVGLASWLDSECGIFRNAADCIYFFEKPWKWSREYELWRQWVDESDAERRELIIEAAMEV